MNFTEVCTSASDHLSHYNTATTFLFALFSQKAIGIVFMAKFTPSSVDASVIASRITPEIYTFFEDVLCSHIQFVDFFVRNL